MSVKITSYSIDQISELPHFIISSWRIKSHTSSLLIKRRVVQVSFRAWLCGSTEVFAQKLNISRLKAGSLDTNHSSRIMRMLYITFHFKIPNQIVMFNSNNTWNVKPARDAGPLDRYIILTSTPGQHQTRYKTTTRSRSIDIVTQPFKDLGDAPK